MTSSRRPRVRSIASRWLVAIAIAAGATVLLPGLAFGAETATLEPATAIEPAAPAGEATPAPADTATEPAGPSSEAPPSDDSSAGTPSGDETTAPDATVPADGGSEAAPAPPPADTPTAAESPSPGSEATPTPAPSPGAEAPATSSPTPLPVTPDLPTSPGATAPAIGGLGALGTPDRVAAIVPDIPSVNVAPTAPDAPTFAAAKKGRAGALPASGSITDFVNAILHPSAAADDVLAATGSRSVAPTAPSFGPVIEDPDFVQPMVIPVGSVPAGSSLLAALAGYVLPGGGGAPPSTLVLFIVLGLILGVSYGAFPRLTERLVAGRLMGASDGHELAVCRPG